MHIRTCEQVKSDIIDIKNFLGSVDLQSGKDQSSGEDFHLKKNRLMNMTMLDVEKEVIIYLLQNNFWNVEKVADLLKQTPRNIYRKMKLFNISRDDRWKDR